MPIDAFLCFRRCVQAPESCPPRFHFNGKSIVPVFQRCTDLEWCSTSIRYQSFCFYVSKGVHRSGVMSSKVLLQWDINTYVPKFPKICAGPKWCLLEFHCNGIFGECVPASPEVTGSTGPGVQSNVPLEYKCAPMIYVVYPYIPVPTTTGVQVSALQCIILRKTYALRAIFRCLLLVFKSPHSDVLYYAKHMHSEPTSMSSPSRRRLIHEWWKNIRFRPTSAGPWVMGDAHCRLTHEIWKSTGNIGWF